MNVSIINAIWAIMVGERLDLDDPNLANLVHAIEEFLHGAAPVSPIAAALPHPSMVTDVFHFASCHFTTSQLASN